MGTSGIQERQRTADEAEEPDLRWDVVERIVASPGFVRSPRLCSFLLCVADLARSGRYDQINEQYLGTEVFGRDPGFDAGIDSIVRSHASRLRQRLDRYFEEEGADEPWRLVIPKGSYVPIFQPLRQVSAPPERPALDQATPVLPPALPPEVRFGAAARTSGRSRLFWGVGLTLLVALAALLLHRRSLTTPADDVARFWAALMPPNRRTLVVNGDSGLVILQGLTGQRITLAAYLDGSYLKPTPLWKTTDPKLLDLGTRRYTAVVDTGINRKLMRLAGTDDRRLSFIYSRDLHPDELKSGNVILLGTYESTPWVRLYEPGMNFYFENDLQHGAFAVYNRHPRPGEQPFYTSNRNDPENTIYGVVAFRPSLNGSDSVLVLEGQSMAGTGTAADFVFDDAYFGPFLHSIRKPDGTLPYFEVLLKSNGMRGEASRLEIVASRVEDQ